MQKFRNFLFLVVLVAGFGGCGTPKPWIEAGFTGKERHDGWKSWRHAGFSPDEAKIFKDAGIYIQEAKNWKSDMFTASEASRWHKNGFSYAHAYKWREYGFDSDNAKNWNNQRVRPKTARKFLNSGVTTKDLNNGFDIKYVKWLKNSLKKTDVYTWGKYYKADAYEYVKRNKKNKVDFEIFKKYKKVIPKESNEFIILLILNNIDLNRAKLIMDIGISELYSLETKEGFLEVINNESLLYRYVAALEYGGLNEERLLIVMKSDLNIEGIKKFSLLSNNILKDDNKLHAVLRYCKKIENKRISNSTPFNTKGKCYNYVGRVSSIRNKTTLEIEECIKTDNQFNDCMGGRVSLMKFDKAIPNNLAEGSYFKGVIQSGGHIKTFLYGNSNKNTDMLFLIIQE